MGETKEIYPGHAEELRRKGERDAVVAQANAEAFPGPVADAFASGPRLLGGYTVRPFVPMDAAVLRRLGSPYYRQILELLKPQELRDEIASTETDEWNVIFLFTRPCAEAEQVLNLGVAEYQRQARAAFAHNPSINLCLYQDLVTACAEQIVGAFRTAVDYRAKATSEAEGFTMPPREKTTAPAGGSVMRPRC